MVQFDEQKGNDGGRLYYDGCAMIWVNGELVAQGSQFEGLDEVEVIVATVSFGDVRSFRANFNARSQQASSAARIPRIDVDFALADCGFADAPSPPRAPRIHTPMEEIALGPSGWLWDYIRRSGMRGYFLPLSGGADSSSTATLGVRIDSAKTVVDGELVSLPLPPGHTSYHTLQREADLEKALTTFLQSDGTLAANALRKVHGLLAALERSTFFDRHVLLRSTLLLVYDDAARATRIELKMMNFASSCAACRTTSAGTPVVTSR